MWAREWEQQQRPPFQSVRVPAWSAGLSFSFRDHLLVKYLKVCMAQGPSSTFIVILTTTDPSQKSKTASLLWAARNEEKSGNGDCKISRNRTFARAQLRAWTFLPPVSREGSRRRRGRGHGSAEAQKSKTKPSPSVDVSNIAI